MFKKMQRRQPVEKAMASFDLEISELAEQIFRFAVTSGQQLPDRLLRETAVKNFIDNMLSSAVDDFAKQRKSRAEAEVYRNLVSAHACQTFEKKWSDLETRLQSRKSSGEAGCVLN